MNTIEEFWASGEERYYWGREHGQGEEAFHDVELVKQSDRNWRRVKVYQRGHLRGHAYFCSVLESGKEGWSFTVSVFDRTWQAGGGNVWTELDDLCRYVHEEI